MAPLREIHSQSVSKQQMKPTTAVFLLLLMRFNPQYLVYKLSELSLFSSLNTRQTQGRGFRTQSEKWYKAAKWVEWRLFTGDNLWWSKARNEQKGLKDSMLTHLQLEKQEVTPLLSELQITGSQLGSPLWYFSVKTRVARWMWYSGLWPKTTKHTCIITASY